MCWSAGTRAVGSPPSCVGRSKRKATRGATAASPRIRVAYVRLRAWLPAVKAAARRCLRRPEQRTADEAQQLAQVRAQSAVVAEAIDLAEDLTTLIRQRQPAQLDPWLKRAATSTLAALRRFAQGLYADYQAVKAGVTLPWSTGPVEGHMNRLKMVKRQMFGRAHLDLLGQRFLRTPTPRTGDPRRRATDASPDSGHSAGRIATRTPSGGSFVLTPAVVRWPHGRSEGLRSGPTSDRCNKRSLAARTRPPDGVDMSCIRYFSFNYHQKWVRTNFTRQSKIDGSLATHSKRRARTACGVHRSIGDWNTHQVHQGQAQADGHRCESLGGPSIC